MIKKIFLVMVLLSTYLVAAMNLQTASKEQLMSIAGIGEKKANAIMEYRKKHKIKSSEDLLNVKGIGKGIVANVQNGVTSKTKGTYSKATKTLGNKKSKATKTFNKNKSKATQAFGENKSKAKKTFNKNKAKAKQKKEKLKNKKDTAKAKMNNMKKMF